MSKDPNLYWREREARRFRDGYYKPVPWAAQEWFLGRHIDHFVHLSRHKPGLLAYTPTEEHGQKDSQVPIKPGRYLKKYFDAALSPDQINYWTAQLRGHESEVKFTNDPLEMEEIYQRSSISGAGACMSKSRRDYNCGRWTPSIHPVHIYCAGDLSLAYIEKADPESGWDGDQITKHIKARVLVWPEKKIYSRAYGDSQRINSALDLEGYRPGLLDGARLLKKPHPQDSRAFAAPFVDHIKWAREESDCLVLSQKATGATISVQHTEGLGYAIPAAPRCHGRETSTLLDWEQQLRAEQGLSETPIKDALQQAQQQVAQEWVPISPEQAWIEIDPVTNYPSRDSFYRQFQQNAYGRSILNRGNILGPTVEAFFMENPADE